MSYAIGSAIAIVVVLAIAVVVMAWFYERATREVSLVRSGIGGRRVAVDGGMVALPYFHEISRVNMQTLRLEVRRTGEDALITKDKLRVDVGVEFHVSVIPNEDAIARASQTLGRKTFQSEQLQALIEGKLVDSLRSVAARMTMDELHENRGAFVADVRDSLVETLERNGLELDSVSLTALDQTPFTALDENNAFNAVGMRILAEVIAKSKKERAEIDADAEVSVRRAAMEATKRKLQISLEEQEAEIAQIQEIEILKAAQLAEVARRKAAGEQEAAQARIQMEREIRAADIAREQAVREAEIISDKQLHEAEIARNREIEIANRESQIVIAAKAEEESKAQVTADMARADAVKASEAVTTVQQTAEAQRRKEIALLAAEQEALASGTRARLTAQADKDAASDRAQAALHQAEARKSEMLAEAEGRRAINSADNEVDDRIVAMKVDLARLETMPRLVAEMVKPAEKIDSIKIHQVSGLGGSQAPASADRPDKSAVNQVLDSILDMAVQMPAMKKIGEEIGESLQDGLAGVSKSKKKSD